MNLRAPAGVLRLGCPVWACADWRGSLYTRAARRQEFLPQYARVFGAVEGNSSFYALPSEATVRRWADEAPPGFRFCFKFPRSVTHENALGAAGTDLDRFLALMRLLPDRLGPLLLQLGPAFAPRELPALDRFLENLPDRHRYSVEVRHPGWYDGGSAEQECDAVLRAHSVARCNFDTHDMFESEIVDHTTAVSQARKPRLPRRAAATAHETLVRFVGRNTIEDSRPALEFWVDQVAAWLEQGHEVFFFTHTPDDAMAPQLARLFHAMLRERLPRLPALAAFEGEAEAARAAEAHQGALF